VCDPGLLREIRSYRSLRLCQEQRRCKPHNNQILLSSFLLTRSFFDQVLYWPSDNTTTDLCGRKGQSAEQCHNYVKLFEPLNGRDGDRAIACGTYSFNAKCKYFKVGDADAQPPGTHPPPFSQIAPPSYLKSHVGPKNVKTREVTFFLETSRMIVCFQKTKNLLCVKHFKRQMFENAYARSKLFIRVAVGTHLNKSAVLTL